MNILEETVVSKNEGIECAVKLALLLSTLKQDKTDAAFYEYINALVDQATGHFISIENVSLAYATIEILTPRNI